MGRTGLLSAFWVLDGDVDDATEERQLPIDGSRGDLLLALGDIPLHVARENLRRLRAFRSANPPHQKRHQSALQRGRCEGLCGV